MEITPGSINLTRCIYSTGGVAVYEAKVIGYPVPVAVRITKDTGSKDEFKMAQLLAKLGSNFIQTYGELVCTGSEYLFAAKPPSTRGIKTTLDLKIKADWGNTEYPPICYDKPITTMVTNTDYGGRSFSYKEEHKTIPLRCVVMEYVPWRDIKTMSVAVKGSVMLQVACAMQLAGITYGFDHNDLHHGNILLRATEAKEKIYPELDTTVPLVGWEAVIIDCEYGRMTLTTPILIGSKLAVEYKLETYLPNPPATAPLCGYCDIGFLWSSLFEYTKTNYDLFFGTHGLKIQGNTGWVLDIIIPFGYMDFIDFVRDPVACLQTLYFKPATIALVKGLA